MLKKQKAKEPKEKMITQSTVLSLGFTKKLIETLLPEPILKNNPHYNCSAPMKLWKEADVLKAMETDVFKSSLAKQKQRKASSQKGKETRIKNLTNEFCENVDIEILNDDTLIQKTLENQENIHRQNLKNEFYYRQNERYEKNSNDYLDNEAFDEYDEYGFDNYSSFEEWEHIHGDNYKIDRKNIKNEILNRWVVNFIRHRLVAYDFNLWLLNKKEKFITDNDKEKIYVEYKKYILSRIAEAYPKYADECKLQIQRV